MISLKIKNFIERFYIGIYTLIILFNGYYFLTILEKSVFEWLTTNLCVAASLIAIIGFLSKNRTISNTAVPLLLTFGIGGFLLMGWDNFMRIYSQLHHILMILNALYILIESFKAKAIDEMQIGSAIGVILVLILVDIGSKPVSF